MIQNGASSTNDMSDPIRQTVYEALREVSGGAVALSDDTLIMGELGLTSVAVLDFVLEIEDRLDIAIPLDRVPGVETVGDLVARIGELKREG